MGLPAYAATRLLLRALRALGGSLLVLNENCPDRKFLSRKRDAARFIYSRPPLKVLPFEVLGLRPTSKASLEGELGIKAARTIFRSTRFG